MICQFGAWNREHVLRHVMDTHRLRSLDGILVVYVIKYFPAGGLQFFHSVYPSWLYVDLVLALFIQLSFLHNIR